MFWGGTHFQWEKVTTLSQQETLESTSFHDIQDMRGSIPSLHLSMASTFQTNLLSLTITTILGCWCSCRKCRGTLTMLLTLCKKTLPPESLALLFLVSSCEWQWRRGCTYQWWRWIESPDHGREKRWKSYSLLEMMRSKRSSKKKTRKKRAKVVIFTASATSKTYETTIFCFQVFTSFRKYFKKLNQRHF